MSTSHDNAESKNVSHTLRERVDRARGIVEDVRERAEVAFHDKPYLLPVAAGALGIGVGLLLGSKLMRFILFTAVGTVIAETFGAEIRRVANSFAQDVHRRLEQETEPEPHAE